MTQLARFRLRTESDLLALVPHTLGFHPEESLVVVALNDQGRPLCARVDLPEDPADLPEFLEQILVAAQRHHARTALVVVYSTDACLADDVGGLLLLSLESRGITVACGIRADGRRWYPLELAVADPDDPLLDHGEPYDVRAHPFTSAAVVEGHVTMGSRAELAATLDADQALVDLVAAAYAELPALSRRKQRLVREAEWLRRRVATLAARRHGHLAEAAADWTAEDAARAVRALQHEDLHDLVWNELARPSAEAHAEVWRSLLRRTPEHLCAPVASMLGFTAWLAGHGALAWCAVERAVAVEPGNRPAALVAEWLEGARPPTTWTPFERGTPRLRRE